MMETIYRIENIHDNKGLHRSFRLFHVKPYKVVERIEKRHGNFSKFPTYSEDYKLKSECNDFWKGEYNFAYNSMDKVREAITRKEMDALRKVGFKIYRITVKRCIQSQYQTIFKSEDVESKVSIPYTYKR